MITAMAGPGERLQPGDAFAKLSQLGRVYSLIVPPGAVGLVVASALAPEGGRLGQCEVAFDQPLLLLDPSAGAHADLAVSSSRAQSQSSGQAFLSPSSGRFYQRPSPDRPPFLQVGQTIKQGQTVGLLEIMKTFTRIPFSGPGLPQEVKVVELLAQDDDELASGDPIFRFESV